MDFALPEEYRLLQQTARAFATAESLPQAARLDEEHRFPGEIVRELGELGLMGVLIPEAYGGAGSDALALALEEISRACAGTGTIMAVNNSLVWDPLLRFGTEEQKRRYLPRLASGQEIGCWCLTELGADSDATGRRTRAVEDGSHWALNGTQSFVTNGREAWFCIVFARSEPVQGSRGISAFLVEKDRRGVMVGRAEREIEINASSTCEIRPEDCRIPKENLLEGRGQGFRIALSTLDGGRIGIAAQAVGIARAALEDALAYAREREQFGRTLVDFQAIRWKFADMSTRLGAARLLTHRAAWLWDRGRPHTLEASVAKLFASETAMWAAHQGMQVFGGYGSLRDCPAQRYFRAARVTGLYAGTSEIQRILVARRLREGGGP